MEVVEMSEDKTRKIEIICSLIIKERSWSLKMRPLKRLEEHRRQESGRDMALRSLQRLK